MSVQGNIKPLRSLTEPLQVAKDNGAKPPSMTGLLASLLNPLERAVM
jgi:hypothetical protein